MEDNNKISTKGLYGYVFGGAIGAGMFVMLPAAIEMTGLSIVVAIILASIVTFFAYFYCAAISSFAAVKGGDYGHIMFVSSPLISGVFGLTVVFLVISNYTYAEGAVNYLSLVFPAITAHTKLITVLLLTLFVFIDFLGANLGSKISSAMAAILTIGILTFIAVGLSKVDFGTLFSFGTGGEPFFRNGFSGLSKAIAYCIWVVGGVGTCAITFSRFVRKPTKLIPKTIVIISVIIAVIACLLCIVCAGAVPVEVASSGLGAVAEIIMPKALFYFFVIGSAALALLTTLQTFIVGYREGIYAYAEQGFLPKFLTKKNKAGYPVNVGIFIWLLSVVPYIFNLSLDQIIAYTSVPVYVCLVYADYKCMRLPEEYPNLWKNSMFHMPLKLWKGICILSAICAAYLVYASCADFNLLQIGQMAFTVILMFVWAIYRMKTKHVNVTAMEKEKAEIIQEALSYEA